MILPVFHPSTLPLFLAFWVHNLDPVIFHLWGPLAVRWYGMAYLSGFLGGYLLLLRLSKRGEFAVPPQDLGNFIVHIAIYGVFLGGRLGYVLRTAWKKKIPFWNMTDCLALVTPIGLFFGRVANFINGELWGRPTEVPWGVVFPQVQDPAPTPRHPSQLYEAFGEGLFLFIALWLIRRTAWGKRDGSLSADFLVIYAIVRIASEFFREPDSTIYFGWLTKGQLYSSFMILAAVIILWRKKLLCKAS